MSRLNPVREWFLRLSEREQWMLQLLIPMLLLTLVVLILLPFWRAEAVAREDYQQQLNQYQWLHGEADSIRLWRQSFGRQSLGMVSGLDDYPRLIQEGMRRHKLTGKIIRNQRGWRVEVDDVAGDNLLAFIESAVGSGLAPQQIVVTRQAEAGMVKATVMFEAMVP